VEQLWLWIWLQPTILLDTFVTLAYFIEECCYFSCACEFTVGTNDFLRQNSSGTWTVISALACAINNILSVLSVTEMKSVTLPDLITKLVCLMFPVMMVQHFNCPLFVWGMISHFQQLRSFDIAAHLFIAMSVPLMFGICVFNCLCSILVIVIFSCWCCCTCGDDCQMLIYCLSFTCSFFCCLCHAFVCCCLDVIQVCARNIW